MPEYTKVYQFIKYIRYVQEQDLDTLIGISGRKGTGKSNLNLLINIEYLRRYGLFCPKCEHQWIITKKVCGRNPPYFEKCPKCKNPSKYAQPFKIYSLNKYVAWDNEDVVKKIHELEAYSPICCDEGVRFAMGEDWNVKENKNLKKLVAQCRPKHLIMIINIPKFAWMDKKYRNDMITFWIRIIRRGLAVILEPDLGIGDDAFMLKEFDKLLGSYFHRTPLADLKKKCINLYNRHPPTFDFFGIPPIPKKLYEKYLVMRNKAVFEKKKKEEKQLTKKDVAKFLIYNLIKHWNDLKAVVERSPVKRPTYNSIKNVLLKHPVWSEENVLGAAAVKTYFKDVDDFVKKETQRKKMEASL
jgi:hypothetical protein